MEIKAKNKHQPINIMTIVILTQIEKNQFKYNHLTD